jgi:hypothetical protein
MNIRQDLFFSFQPHVESALLLSLRLLLLP